MTTSPEETLNLRRMRNALSDTHVLPASQTTRTLPPDACLVHIHPTGPTLGRRYPITTEPLLFGRESDCSITIPEGSVSRHHARVSRRPDGLYLIEDLGSTNGTFVNDARTQVRALTDGDYLRIGPCIYRFLASGNVEADYHEEIHRLAVMDPLTGLHNRRAVNDFLAREVDRAARYDRPLTVVLFDLDHFKQVNDRLGHLGGDITLKELASRLRQSTRKDELLARYGGEEFLAILPETDLVGALAYAERARRSVADIPFTFDGRVYSVTVSAGVGVRPNGSELLVADLLRQADERLYEAKRSGRNRVAPRARVDGGSGTVEQRALRVPTVAPEIPS